MHIAFILDGNRRYAKKAGIPSIEGHRQGLITVRDRIIEVCLEQNVEVLTLYTFSTENWKRSNLEVNGLMKLFEEMIDSQIDTYMERGVRLKHLGRKDRLPKSVIKKLAEGEEKTKNNTTLTVCLAMDYGSQDEIVRAIARLADSGERLAAPEDFEKYLDTAGLPPVDLLIRTGGDQRISNFLLWQSAYAELKFLPQMLPELTKEDVVACIEEYRERERRFGS